MNDDFIDQDVIADFLDEAGQCVATLNENLLQVEEGDISPGQVDEMFRAAHSMKGAAGFLNLSSISKVTHSLETVLDKIRKNELQFSPEVLDALFTALDIISALLAELSTEQQGTVDINFIVEALEELLNRERPQGDDSPEKHLGPIPDFIEGRMELDDMLEMLIAKNMGKRVFVIKLSLKSIFSHQLDPVSLYHSLETAVYVQATVPLMEAALSIWMPLENYNSEIAVVVFSEADIDTALSQILIPPCQAWELCTSDTELPPPITIDNSFSVQLGDPFPTLEIEPAMEKHKSIWLSETKEELSKLDTAILNYENEPDNQDSLNETFRLMHRIKGSSGSMGLKEITRISHNCESLLAHLRDNAGTPDDNIFHILYLSKDILHECVNNIEEGKTEAPSAVELDKRFEKTLNQLHNIPSPIPATPAWTIEEKLQKSIEDYQLSGTKVWKMTVKVYEDTPLADIRYGMVLRNLDDICEVLFSEPDLQHLEAGVENCPPLHVVTAGNISEQILRDNAQIDMIEHIEIEELAVKETKQATPGKKTAPAVKNMAKPGAAQIDTVRVDTQRLDHLMNIAGELAITKARINQLVEIVHNSLRGCDMIGIEMMVNAVNNNQLSAKNSSLTENRLNKIQQWLDEIKQTQQLAMELRDTSLRLHSNTSQIQSSVMQMRMVPIGPLFQRFHRLVRDLCKEKNKQARLVTLGEHTELDKKLIDELADPLTHLIRNSVDHGLENGDDRTAVGKPAQGTVQLEAFHEGSQICIRIKDDGQGLSIEKIKHKALNNNITTADALNRMTDADIYQLIFQPGFSTAEKITNISGRGVGMDIVKNKVTELKGKIDIDSEPGQGCSFTIRLPLTLAMIQTLLVEIGGAKYAIPLESVREISEFPIDDIKTVEGKGKIISLRNQVIAMINLADTIGIERYNEEVSSVKTIITKGSSAPLAIPVDKILGQDEVVVKPLTDDFASVKGLAGATVLGDGRIALILNIPAIRDICCNIDQLSDHATTKDTQPQEANYA